MHVLILNQTFYPDVAATAQHMWDLARYLDARGHRVTAVASRNFYGTDRQHENGHERIGRIEIRRVSGTRFGKRTHLGRVLDFGSYYAAAAWELQHLPTPDVILALTSPPMVATLGMLQKQFRLTRAGRPVRFVYHIMDLYPDAAVAMNFISPGLRTDRAMRRLTGRTLDLADAVIALGRDMKDRILRQYGHHAHASRIHVVPPWAECDELRPMDRRDGELARSLELNDGFNIVYSGNLGVAHDVETITHAIRAMRDDAGVRWIFIGGGARTEALVNLAKSENWRHVRFLPFQERAKLNESLNLADVHLVSQLPAFTGVVVPSKLFGVLAVGKPSVMVGPADSECARIVNEIGGGIVIDNGDVDGLVCALRRLRDNPALRQEMGTRARAACERLYDAPVACHRIEKILQNVVFGPPLA